MIFKVNRGGVEKNKGLIEILTIIFVLGLIKSNETAIEIFNNYKDNENQFRKNIIVPLFRLKGFKQVIDIHGIDEHGRDIVCYMNDYFDNRINYGIQVKATNIHSNNAKHGNVTEITTQLTDAFRLPFRDTFTTADRMIHQMYVITSKKITSGAERAIVEGNYEHKHYVHYIDGSQLEEEWIKTFQL